MSILTKIFGDANKRFLNDLRNVVEAINKLEPSIKTLDDGGLKAKTAEFRKAITDNHIRMEPMLNQLLNDIKNTANDADQLELRRQYTAKKNELYRDILPEAFAVVREAARRTLGQRHFDVQLLGGMVLHQGQVAEMRTGEGKTLTSTLPIYLNALLGKGVHVVTVNDYLARRDAVWMAKIYSYLGLSVGVIAHEAAYLYDPEKTNVEAENSAKQEVTVDMEFLTPVERRTAYAADITYGTNNEFGFDYLRDNLVLTQAHKVQRPLNYAIIDEADSILIDEARTPLIISAPDIESTDRYYQFARMVGLLEENVDYNVDEKLRAATLTEQGIAKVEKELGVDNIYVEQGIQTVHHIEQALKAKTLYLRDRDYTVKDGQVIIVDEFTGRLMQGRRYSEGLHQAIEAKEGVAIQRESKTMATVTIQNYFRQYEKLAGMTGTAETEAEELAKIYNLEVTTIPTHKPMIRADHPDRIYKTQEAKLKAIVDEIKERHAQGQPILVGTVSIEKNEYLSHLLELEGLKFNLLNAKQHEREAEIIAQAGAFGAITVATNMAGRGVDIKLGGSPFSDDKFQQITKLGGLHIVGTERHESRRIDNQLRGRAGRQGEPGSSRFYVSMEDDLMRIFGSDRLKRILPQWPDDMPIENALISRSIESAQKKVEGHNFDIRKHLLEYDDIINRQRQIIYQRRDQILDLASNDPSKLETIIEDELKDEIIDIIGWHAAGDNISNWNTKEISETLHSLYSLEAAQVDEINKLPSVIGNPVEARDQLVDKALEWGKQKMKLLMDRLAQQLMIEPSAASVDIIKTLYLRSIDLLWAEHLETINYLRTGIGLRGYGQRDPLVEYKRESKDLFNRLLTGIRRQFVGSLFKVTIGRKTAPGQEQTEKMHEQKSAVQAFSGKEQTKKAPAIAPKPKDAQGHKLGRNDPCFCGSGKKYKHCHGQ